MPSAVRRTGSSRGWHFATCASPRRQHRTKERRIRCHCVPQLMRRCAGLRRLRDRPPAGGRELRVGDGAQSRGGPCGTGAAGPGRPAPGHNECLRKPRAIPCRPQAPTPAPAPVQAQLEAGRPVPRCAHRGGCTARPRASTIGHQQNASGPRSSPVTHRGRVIN
jgi:hypothetical protein